MANQTITEQPTYRNCRLLHKQICKKPTYGKPSKPRCQEPSMFQILSWKDQTQQKQLNAIQSHQQALCNNIASQQRFLKRNERPNYQSLLTDQFAKSINFDNHSPPEINFQDRNNLKISQPHQNLKNLNDADKTDLIKNEKDYQSQYIKKALSQKKQIKTSKQSIKFDSTKIQTNKFKKNIQASPHSVNEKEKNVKKKSSYPSKFAQSQPRYLEKKKTALQKLLQSPTFNPKQFEKIKQEQIKKFKRKTRDLPNSAFLTFFNKPPFENYGRSNQHNSGILYGDYMYSHNVFPHTGDNHPQKLQTYETALKKAKSAGNIKPHFVMMRSLQDKIFFDNSSQMQIFPKNAPFESIPINNQTVLDSLPLFNYKKYERKYVQPKQSAQLNQNEQNMQNKYQNNSVKYWDNTFNCNNIKGKSIFYTKKLTAHNKQ